MLGICDYNVMFIIASYVCVLYNVSPDSTNVELKLNGNTPYDKASELGKHSNSANVTDIMCRTNLPLSKY